MTRFDGTVWRMVFVGQNAALPVTSPEGRFHHSGQRALYTSLTAEGTQAAVARYVQPDDAAREMVPLDLNIAHVFDARAADGANAVWHKARDNGEPAPTWALSDFARDQGAAAMLYTSRTRPDLTHLVLFGDPATLITGIGTPVPWTPPRQ